VCDSLKTLVFPIRSVYVATSWQDATPLRMTAVFRKLPSAVIGDERQERVATFETPAKTPGRPLPIAVQRIVPAMSARGAANNAPRIVLLSRKGSPPIGIGAYKIVDDVSRGTPAKSKDPEWMDNTARSVKRLPSD
jgi:hypothetical protein